MSELPRDTPPPLLLYDEAEFAALPRGEFLVDGILPVGGNAMVYGQNGSGKTFLALDLGCSVASGRPWHGRAVKQGLVVYVTAEGRGGFASRLAAWRDRHPTDCGPMLIHPAALSLLVGTNADRLVDAMEARLPLLGDELPLLLIFDTLHRCIPGADENGSDTVSLVLATLDRIRQSFPLATVILVHHPTKAGLSPRGSGAWADDLDAVLCVEREKGSMSLRLTCEKQRDAEPFEPLTLELEPHAGSLVLADAAGYSVRDRRHLSAAERRALQVLDDLAPESVSWSRWQSVAELAPSSLSRHRRRLLDLGLVCIVGAGRRTTYQLTGEGIAALSTPVTSTELPRDFHGTTSITSAPPIKGASGSGRSGTDGGLPSTGPFGPPLSGEDFLPIVEAAEREAQP